MFYCGRVAGQDVVYDASSRAAVPLFARRDGAWQLRDVGSTNGTTLNGRALVGEPSDFVALKDGDLVRFGTETVARVELAAAPSEAITVEEFVQAECVQLEQRIRCARAWVEEIAGDHSGLGGGMEVGCVTARERASGPYCSRQTDAASRTSSCAVPSPSPPRLLQGAHRAADQPAAAGVAGTQGGAADDMSGVALARSPPPLQLTCPLSSQHFFQLFYT